MPPTNQKEPNPMLNKLKNKKAEIAALRDERGATDPILIIAGIAITLILLVGGSFAIAGFMNNAKDLNAKGDLDRIATAQAAYMAENDAYATTVAQLRNSSIGFTPTEGGAIAISANATGWVAVSVSASGTAFYRTSASAAITETAPSTAGGLPAAPAVPALP